MISNCLVCDKAFCTCTPRAAEEPNVEKYSEGAMYSAQKLMGELGDMNAAHVRHIAELRAEVERLKADVAEAKRREDKNAESCRQALAARDSLWTERDALKAKYDKLSAAFYNPGGALEKVAEQTATIDALKADADKRVQELARRAALIDALKAELAGLSGERDRLDNDNWDLRQQLAEAKAVAGRWHDALFELRSRIEALADEWERAGVDETYAPDARMWHVHFMNRLRAWRGSTGRPSSAKTSPSCAPCWRRKVTSEAQ